VDPPLLSADDDESGTQARDRESEELAARQPLVDELANSAVASGMTVGMMSALSDAGV
jgi:hypothetical protein